jgi:hypothetical protein
MPVVYRVDGRMFGNARFVDVWGVSREELEKLPGISTVIGETVWGSLTVMVDMLKARETVSEIVSRYGATELADVVQR